MAKIVFIGAGSMTFTRGLLSDLFLFDELAGQLDIVLHDIDRERLETSAQAARALSDATGAAARVQDVLDRRRALDGADYVINEIQVGGFEATLKDFEIPARYGLRQTIADTIGIGGIFRGLRTIPVLVDIAREMSEVCPDAWLLNYTNPMIMLPWAVRAATPHRKVLGLCHSVRDTQAFLARTVGRPVDDVDFVTAGVNHQAFVLRFEQDGRSLYPLLDEAIERDPQLRRRVRVELYRQFGFFPTESSEHSAEYVPWLMRHEEEVAYYRIPIGEYVRRSESNLAEYDELKRQLLDGGVAPEPAEEIAPLIIHSLETGTRRTLNANVINDDLLDGYPPECCVEVPCEIGDGAVVPQRVGTMPPQLRALNRTFINVAELTVSAALEGRRDYVLQAALMDPNTAATLPLRQIRALVDDMIDAHRGQLPAGIG